jgi:hypothetical protein
MSSGGCGKPGHVTAGSEEGTQWCATCLEEVHVPVGRCLNCGERLTFCGIPFTADIVCQKCKRVNIFVNSQQPISVRTLAEDALKAQKAPH